MRRYRKLDLEHAYAPRARTWKDAIGATCRVPTEQDKFNARMLEMAISGMRAIEDDQRKIMGDAFKGAIGTVWNSPKFGKLTA